MFIYNEQGEVLDFAPEVYSMMGHEIILTNKAFSINQSSVNIDWNYIFDSHLTLTEEFIVKFIERADHIVLMTKLVLTDTILDRMMTIIPTFRMIFEYRVLMFSKFKFSLDIIRKYKERIDVNILMYSGFYDMEDLFSIYEDTLTPVNIISGAISIIDIRTMTNGMAFIPEWYTSNFYIYSELFNIEIFEKYYERAGGYTADKATYESYHRFIWKYPKSLERNIDKINWDILSSVIGVNSWGRDTNPRYFSVYARYKEKINWDLIDYKGIINGYNTYPSYTSKFLLTFNEYLDWYKIYDMIYQSDNRADILEHIISYPLVNTNINEIYAEKNNYNRPGKPEESESFWAWIKRGLFG